MKVCSWEIHGTKWSANHAWLPGGIWYYLFTLILCKKTGENLHSPARHLSLCRVFKIGHLCRPVIFLGSIIITSFWERTPVFCIFFPYVWWSLSLFSLQLLSATTRAFHARDAGHSPWASRLGLPLDAGGGFPLIGWGFRGKAKDPLMDWRLEGSQLSGSKSGTFSNRPQIVAPWGFQVVEEVIHLLIQDYWTPCLSIGGQ